MDMMQKTGRNIRKVDAESMPTYMQDDWTESSTHNGTVNTPGSKSFKLWMQFINNNIVSTQAGLIDFMDIHKFNEITIRMVER